MQLLPGMESIANCEEETEKRITDNSFQSIGMEEDLEGITKILDQYTKYEMDIQKLQEQMKKMGWYKACSR